MICGKTINDLLNWTESCGAWHSTTLGMYPLQSEDTYSFKKEWREDSNQAPPEHRKPMLRPWRSPLNQRSSLSKRETIWKWTFMTPYRAYIASQNTKEKQNHKICLISLLGSIWLTQFAQKLCAKWHFLPLVGSFEDCLDDQKKITKLDYVRWPNSIAETCKMTKFWYCVL